MQVNSVNRNSRDQTQEILIRLSKLQGSPLHRDFLDLISLKLEVCKDRLVSSPAADLLGLQGQAKALADLLTDLNRPILSDILKKETQQ